MAAAVTPDTRIERLSTASLRTLIEPELALEGEVGPGQILPDELLSVNGLDVDLTAEQRARLSREEIASILDMGVRFETVLMAGFCLELAGRDDLCDPRVAYALHEIGEESRHSRMFTRLLDQLQPTAANPLRPGGRLGRWFELRSNFAITRRPALFTTLILAGEEIPDLLQKLASEHPDTDAHVAAVNRYHRQEEARHLAFARLLLAERWNDTSRLDRFLVRRVAPIVIRELFHTLVQPGVYATVGLPAWRTWFAVRRLPQRRALQQRATRSVLAALVNAGVFRPGHVPTAWRRLCNVDRRGQPLSDAAHR